MANNYTYTPPVGSTSITGQKGNRNDPTHRIYSIFPHTINLDEISLPKTSNSDTQNIEDVASIEYPLIRINDYILSRDEIVSMTIDSTGFMPQIILSAIFFDDVFISREMPKDGDIISIAIRSKSDVIRMIRNDYVITNVMPVSKTTLAETPTHMTLYGELFIPAYASSKGSFSFEGTSLETLRAFASWVSLGFATNEDNTDDKQIWLYTKYANQDFISDVVSAAYRDDKSFYSAWIDVYYNLNFVNMNKQMLSSESEVDPAALINNIDKDWTYGTKSNDEQTIQAPKVFSNYMSYRTTPFFINSWKPTNRSSAITFSVGTKTWCGLFEHSDKTYKDENSQKYWSLEMEPTYDDNKTDRYILLRGRASYHANKENKDLSRANYSYTDLYARYPWMGVQYTISNPEEDNLKWDGNQHKNYMRARVQNTINNRELDKLNLEITVGGINMNIIKGDKVPVALIKTNPAQNLKINPAAKTFDMLDMFYSGWYLVKGFSIQWSGNNRDSILSSFKQSMILTRREWPPPVAVQSIKGIENKNTL